MDRLMKIQDAQEHLVDRKKYVLYYLYYIRLVSQKKNFEEVRVAETITDLVFNSTIGYLAMQMARCDVFLISILRILWIVRTLT